MLRSLVGSEMCIRDRLRRVALAYVVGVTLDVSWQILDGRSWFFSGSAMSLAPSSINPEKRKPRETKKVILLLLYARNLTAFCTYFNEHTLTSHRNCVATLAHTCCRRLPTYASISHPSDSSHICFVFWFYVLLSENGGDERCSSCRAHEARREKSA